MVLNVVTNAKLSNVNVPFFAASVEGDVFFVHNPPNVSEISDERYTPIPAGFCDIDDGSPPSEVNAPPMDT